MSKLASTFTTLMGSAAMAAMMFNSPAANARDIYNDNANIDRALSNEVVSLTQDNMHNADTRYFLAMLSITSKKLKDTPVIVPYPENAKVGELQLVGVLPAVGQQAFVCAENMNRVIGTWQITSDGQVVRDTWNGQSEGALQSDGKVVPACKPYIMDRGQKMMSESKVAAPLTPESKSTPTATSSAPR